jgi:hypothetical protein
MAKQAIETGEIDQDAGAAAFETGGEVGCDIAQKCGGTAWRWIASPGRARRH